jgi:IclR family transcriptional regulator, positive regulator for flagellar biogenesis
MATAKSPHTRPTARAVAPSAARSPVRASSSATPRPDTVSALDRGLVLLNCFRDGQRVLSATELARLAGIPRPTVIRLAATLVAHRWLQVEPGGDRYMLGAGVVSLAQSFLAGLDVRAVARTPMQALADSCAGSVYLAVRDGLEMVLIEACRAQSTMLSARLDVGSRIPLANSALGRAYLGALDSAARTPLLDGLRVSHGKDWPTFEPGLRKALAESARTGLCVSAGEFHREINSVSVALRGPRAEVLSFNCGGPAFAFSERRLRNEIAPALVQMARQIAQHIGGAVALPEGF